MSRLASHLRRALARDTPAFTAAPELRNPPMPSTDMRQSAALQEHAGDVVLALTLSASVLDAWIALRPADRDWIRDVYPRLAAALDALEKGPRRAGHP
jgi:hypothetical protein